MKKILITFSLLLIIKGVSGQSISSQVIGAGGTEFGNSNFSLTWTLGEQAVTFYTLSNGSLSEGFQQAENSTTGISERLNNIQTQINLLSNPVNDILRLSNTSQQPVFINIYDMTGKSIKKTFIKAGQSQAEINVAELLNAPYMLHCTTTDGSFIQNIKFIKSK